MQYNTLNIRFQLGSLPTCDRGISLSLILSAFSLSLLQLNDSLGADEQTLSAVAVLLEKKYKIKNWFEKIEKSWSHNIYGQLFHNSFGNFKLLLLSLFAIWKDFPSRSIYELINTVGHASCSNQRQRLAIQHTKYQVSTYRGRVV